MHSSNNGQNTQFPYFIRIKYCLIPFQARDAINIYDGSVGRSSAAQNIANPAELLTDHFLSGEGMSQATTSQGSSMRVICSQSGRKAQWS